MAEEIVGRTDEGGLAVVWVRHHWVAARFKPRSYIRDASGRVTSVQEWEVWDSARSLIVERDLQKLARELSLENPVMRDCPQQHRESNECGLFASAYVWRMAADAPIPASLEKISLQPLRHMYPDIRRMKAAVECLLYGIPFVYRYNPYGDSITAVRNPQVQPLTGVETSAIDNGGRTIGQCRCEDRCRGVCALAKSRPRGGSGAEEACDVDALDTGRDGLGTLRGDLLLAQENLVALRRESRDGAMVRTSTLDAMLETTVGPAARDAGYRQISVSDERAYAADIKRPVLRPILYNEHFVLLVVSNTETTVYDSIPTYATESRTAKILQVTDSNNRRRVVLVNTGPQLKNECAFRCVKAAIHALGIPWVHTEHLRREFLQPLIDTATATRDRLAQAWLEVQKELPAEVALDILLDWNTPPARKQRLLEGTLQPIGPSAPTAVPGPATTKVAKSALSPLAAPFVPTTPKGPGAQQNALEKPALVGMSIPTCIEVMRWLRPYACVEVTWYVKEWPSRTLRTWGVIGEVRGSKDRRWWEVEYRYIDSRDGKETTLTSNLPCTRKFEGHDVVVLDVRPVSAVPPPTVLELQFLNDEPDKPTAPGSTNQGRIDGEQVRHAPAQQVARPPSYEEHQTRATQSIGDRVVARLPTYQEATGYRVANRVPRLSRTPSPEPRRPTDAKIATKITFPSPESSGEQAKAPAIKEKQQRENRLGEAARVVTLELTPPPTSPHSTQEEIVIMEENASDERGATDGLKRGAKGKVEPRFEEERQAAIWEGAVPDQEDELLLRACPLTNQEAAEIGISAPTKGYPSRFGDLRRLVMNKPVTMHPVARKALSAATRDEHVRVIRTVIREAPTNYNDWGVGKALLELLMQLKKSRQWKWATTAKKAASLQGALRILQLYVDAASVDLSRDAEWASGVRYLNAKAREEQPRAVVSATFADMQTAVRQGTPLTQGALALAWLVAGRFGDILSLDSDDIKLEQDVVTITYRRGKTVSKRGPYTVFSQVPDVWMPHVRGAVSRKGRVFAGVKVKDLTKALRSRMART